MPVIVRMLETGRVVRFYRTIPLAVVQPVPRVAVEAPGQPAPEPVRGVENFPDDVWQRFVANRRRRLDGKGRGTYRAEQRRRSRADPVPGTADR